MIASPTRISSHAPRPLRLALALAVALTLLVRYVDSRTLARQIRLDAATVESVETLYVPAAWTTRLFFLGYDQAAADAVWLKAIEYFASHFTTDRRYPFLTNFVDLVIELDPRFRRVYHWAGASVLYGQTFTNNNIRLSNRFYEAALKAYPEDSEAALRLGLNYYVEMHSTTPEEKRRYQEKGAEYLEMAANMPGASPRLKVLVASIRTKLGQTELAVQSLLQMLENTDDDEQRAAIEARIRELRADDEGAAELASQVAAFETRRRAHFEYLPPALYLLMDGKADQASRLRERSWQELIPDVSVAESPAATEEK